MLNNHFAYFSKLLLKIMPDLGIDELITKFFYNIHTYFDSRLCLDHDFKFIVTHRLNADIVI